MNVQIIHRTLHIPFRLHTYSGGLRFMLFLFYKQRIDRFRGPNFMLNITIARVKHRH